MAVLSSRPSDEDVVDSSAGRKASGPDPGRCVATQPPNAPAAWRALRALPRPQPRPPTPTRLPRHTHKKTGYGDGVLYFTRGMIYDCMNRAATEGNRVRRTERALPPPKGRMLEPRGRK